MGLKTWLVTKLGGSVPHDAPGATGEGMVFADMISAISQQFQQSYKRAAVHRDMDRMDCECEVVSKGLTLIASRAMGYPDPTVNSFTVVVEDKEPQKSQDGQTVQSAQAKKAQRIAEDLIERAKLRPMSWQVIRKGAKYGNDFREILFETNEQGQYIRIAGLKPLPEQTVWPNTDQFGNRVDGYTQRMENMPTGGPEVKFQDYQIVHFLFGAEDFWLGTPLLMSARMNWNRLGLGEDATAIARVTRAFTKLIHRVPVNGNDPKEEQAKALRAYKNEIRSRKIWDDDKEALQKRDNPLSVNTDFYIPDDGSGRGGVDMLDPENAQLQNVADLEYFLLRIIDALTVPLRYFAIDGGNAKLSEGGGNAEDVNFACTLLLCHQMLQQGFDKLFAIEFALHGLDYQQFRIVYRMADLSTIDLLRAAQRDKAKSSTLTDLVRVMPGLLNHADVMLREFTSMSDVSVSKLKGDDKLTEGAMELLSKSPSPDSRIQTPGMGEERPNKV